MARLKSLSLLALPLLAALAFVLLKQGAITLGGDAPGYLYFHPTRPLGYPLFLAAVHLVSSHYAVLPYLQAGLLGGSVGVLGLAIVRATGRFGVALFVEVIGIANPSYWSVPLGIM